MSDIADESIRKVLASNCFSKARKSTILRDRRSGTGTCRMHSNEARPALLHAIRSSTTILVTGRVPRSLRHTSGLRPTNFTIWREYHAHALRSNASRSYSTILVYPAKRYVSSGLGPDTFAMPPVALDIRPINCNIGAKLIAMVRPTKCIRPVAMAISTTEAQRLSVKGVVRHLRRHEAAFTLNNSIFSTCMIGRARRDRQTVLIDILMSPRDHLTTPAEPLTLLWSTV
jgi:hypothetical protein